MATHPYCYVYTKVQSAIIARNVFSPVYACSTRTVSEREVDQVSKTQTGAGNTMDREAAWNSQCDQRKKCDTGA